MIFEKIREELQESHIWIEGNGYGRPDMNVVILDEAIETINEIEAEYNNGWILCSERLPEPNKCCLITYKVSGVLKIAVWLFNGVDFNQTEGVEVIAWQQLPQPPKGE